MPFAVRRYHVLTEEIIQHWHKPNNHMSLIVMQQHFCGGFVSIVCVDSQDD